METLQQENFIKLKPIDAIDEWNWLEMTIKMLKKRPDYLIKYENHIYFYQDDANVCFGSLELDSHKLLWLAEGKEYDISIDVGGLILEDKENGAA